MTPVVRAAAPLRIVAWNCNQALHRKAGALRDLDPDIVVIAECGATDDPFPGSWHRVGWTGRNPVKGLGVFVRAGIAATVDPSWDPEREWFLPVRIDTQSHGAFPLLAVWAMNHRGAEPGPLRHRTERAVQHHGSFLRAAGAVVIGDFNDNGRWDRPRTRHFARVVEELDRLGLASLFHHQTGEPHGRETGASLYFHRHLDEPYLVDHAFIDRSMLDSARLSIGTPDPWLGLSDHMPLVVELERLDRDTEPGRPAPPGVAGTATGR